VQLALDEFRALELRYFTAGRDETTDRVVDPIRMFTSEGRAYLEAWCRRAEGLRVFRLDRIEAAAMLDEPASVPPHVQPRELSEGVYDPAPEHLLVDLLLTPAYEWVAEHYVIEDESTSEAGHQISLRVSDPAWVRALVLSSSGAVTVLSPPWLAEDIRASARSALAAYAV
jgi:proteasome accessory factor C